MNYENDIIILGGGIIGCSIAYFLAKRGAQVAVLEKGHIGAQASSAAAGLLAPIRPLSREDSFKTLQLVGMKRFPSFVPELEDASGIAVGYTQPGTLRVLPLEKVAPTQTWADEWRQAGFSIEVLSPEEACAREPLLAPDFPGAVYIADEAQVVPAQLTKAFVAAARGAGVQLYEHTEVVAFERSMVADKIEGVWTTRGDLFTCNTLVIAAGAWSAKFGSWLGVPLPIRPVRGEIVALQQPSPPIHHIVFDEGIFDEDVYLAPRPDGTIIVGATKAEVEFDTSVSAGGVQHLLDVAIKLLPVLASCSIERMWAGLRPKTPNSRPILGVLPGWKNIIIAGGHGGFGITLSVITGETIAELVTTGVCPPIIRPFSLQESIPG